MEKIIKQFKGGSLSSTNLIEDNGKFFVRKSVSLLSNREYGFQRWYSQLKKLQRYSVMYPELFPKVLNYGKNHTDAFFDIEFYENGVNAYQYLKDCSSEKQVKLFFNSLILVIDELHKERFDTSKDSINLYLHEEIDQRLNECYKDKFFLDFLKSKKIIFNGVEVDSFVESLNDYKLLLQKNFNETTEIFSHGNMTLENIIFIPEFNKIVFIDPYEENIIDSELAEYSQLLQSSNSNYETYNSVKAEVLENKILLEIDKPYGISCFNDLLMSYLSERFTNDQLLVIKLLEVSQFIRMLPFKMAVDKSKMVFFYGLASFLLDNIKNDNRYER